MQLSERQEGIVSLVKRFEPITSDQIAEYMGLTIETLRPDLSILTMSGLLDAKPRMGYFYNEKASTTLKCIEYESLLVKDAKSIPIVVQENDTIYDAVVSLFINADARNLIVVSEGGRLAGMVSQKDLLKCFLGKPDLDKIPIRTIMTSIPNVITIEGSDTVLTAARKMFEHEVDCLPVVKKIDDPNQEGYFEVIGRISRSNIARIFVEMLESK